MPFTFQKLSRSPRKCETVRAIAANTLPDGQRQLLKHLDAEMEVTTELVGSNGKWDGIQFWNAAAAAEADESLTVAGVGKIEQRKKCFCCIRKVRKKQH